MLFVRSTLKPQIFNLELMLRPRATEHYINYLRQCYEIENLMDLLEWVAPTCNFKSRFLVVALSQMNTKLDWHLIWSLLDVLFRADVIIGCGLPRTLFLFMMMFK